MSLPGGDELYTPSHYCWNRNCFLSGNAKCFTPLFCFVSLFQRQYNKCGVPFLICIIMATSLAFFEQCFPNRVTKFLSECNWYRAARSPNFSGPGYRHKRTHVYPWVKRVLWSGLGITSLIWNHRYSDSSVLLHSSRSIIQNLGIFGHSGNFLAFTADYWNCRISNAGTRNPLFSACRKCRQVFGNAGIAENSQILDMYEL